MRVRGREKKGGGGGRENSWIKRRASTSSCWIVCFFACNVSVNVVDAV